MTLICCVCMAVDKSRGAKLIDGAPERLVTLYGGSAYCLEHLPHIDEAVGPVRRAKELAP